MYLEHLYPNYKHNIQEMLHRLLNPPFEVEVEEDFDDVKHMLKILSKNNKLSNKCIGNTISEDHRGMYLNFCFTIDTLNFMGGVFMLLENKDYEPPTEKKIR